MKTFKTGQEVGYGLYVAPKALDMKFVGAEGETLEGKEGATYFRLPILLMIAASPVIGGVFVMVFPVLVVLMAAFAVVQFVGKKIGELAGENAHLAVMRWEPTAAYLNKKKAGSKKEKEEAPKKV